MSKCTCPPCDVFAHEPPCPDYVPPTATTHADDWMAGAAAMREVCANEAHKMLTAWVIHKDCFWMAHSAPVEMGEFIRSLPAPEVNTQDNPKDKE